MSSTQDIDAKTVIELLPACNRCRSQRKRCDTLLPACANCQKSENDCMFYDHGSEQQVDRKYIASLLERMNGLEHGHSPSRGISSSHSNHGHSVDARGALRHIGANACIASDGANVARESSSEAIPKLSIECPILPLPSWPVLNQELHGYLLRLYFENLHGPYPIIDKTGSCFGETQPLSDQLSTGDALILSLVYSAACHCLPDNDNRLLLLSRSLRSTALAKSGGFFLDISISVLQAVLLLCLNSFFDPEGNSIGQQITLAYRIWVELEAGAADEQTKETLQGLLRPLYSLGNQHARTLDRPSAVLTQFAAECLNASHESDFLCSLHLVPSVVVKGTSSLTDVHMPSIAELEQLRWSPLTLSSLYETRLLIEPSSSSALELLQVYGRKDMLFTAFTPHWAFKAGMMLLLLGTKSSHDDRRRNLRLALSILQLCAAKWPGSHALLTELRDASDSTTD